MPRVSRQIAGRLALTAICLCIAIPALSQFTANRRPPRPNVVLPEGPARQVILQKCTQCHGIDEYGFYAMERERWASVIERMKTATSGVVEGMTISDADAEILLDWLVAEFGPDTTPMKREYVVAELTADEHLDDVQAQLVIETACLDCHGTEQINDASLDSAQWRERVTLEIGRGAALLIRDAEPLVQWIARSQD